MPYPTQCLLQYIQFVLLVHNPMFNHLYISTFPTSLYFNVSKLYSMVWAFLSRGLSFPS